MSTGLELVKVYLNALARGPGLHTFSHADYNAVGGLLNAGCKLDKRSPKWPAMNEGTAPLKGPTSQPVPGNDDYGSAEDVAQSPAVVATIGEDVVTGEEMPDAIVEEGDVGPDEVPDEFNRVMPNADRSGELLSTKPPAPESNGLVRQRAQVQAPRTATASVNDLHPHPAAPRYE